MFRLLGFMESRRCEERIIRLRQSGIANAPRKSQDTTAPSKNNVISALHIRVKDLEERNRELEVRLELAYGQLASSKSNHR